MALPGTAGTVSSAGERRRALPSRYVLTRESWTLAQGGTARRVTLAELIENVGPATAASVIGETREHVAALARTLARAQWQSLGASPHSQRVEELVAIIAGFLRELDEVAHAPGASSRRP